MTRVLGLVFVGIVTLGAVARGADIPLPSCRLDVPVNIGSQNLLDKGLVLKNVSFDRTPRFPDPEAYEPARDVLDLALFNIEWNQGRTNWLGGSLQVEGALHRVGFSPSYLGDFQGRGSVFHYGDSTIYVTRQAWFLNHPPHVKGEAVTELRVRVKNGQIISVQLTTPVFRTISRARGTKRLAFTGENQVLCLRKAN